EPLINLLGEFGFNQSAIKTTDNGREIVLVKNFSEITNNIREDFPIINARGKKKFLLSIKPEWHTKLFPDSILNSESYDVLQDTSHTNSIFKTYVCFMDLSELSNNDIIIIYRTSDQPNRAWYRSVVTSVCTVEEVRSSEQFENIKEYINSTETYSVFNENELLTWWDRRGRLYVLKMLYNAAFSRRLIRKNLIEDFGLDSSNYWGFFELSDVQFMNIIQAGGINESIVIN
ncbi:N-acetyltransferase, partial [Candidatus Latescibacterota bacterium]